MKYTCGAISCAGFFEVPEYSADVNAIGTSRILEAISSLNLEKS